MSRGAGAGRCPDGGDGPETGAERRVGGVHAVETALAGGSARVYRLLADPRRRDGRMRRLLERARRAGVTVERCDGEAITAWLGDTRHQGIAAELAGTAILDEAGLLERINALSSPPLLLVLDGVQDPHNLGACLRTAEAAGADAVVIPRDRAARLTPTVERAAAGATEHIPIAAVTNLARTLERLQQAGVWVIGTAGEATTSLYDADLAGPLALVCGGEADGLRRRTRQLCDDLVTIPLAGRTASLNVSVAAGVCLFEALRQRGPRVPGERGGGDD